MYATEYIYRVFLSKFNNVNYYVVHQETIHYMKASWWQNFTLDMLIPMANSFIHLGLKSLKD